MVKTPIDATEQNVGWSWDCLGKGCTGGRLADHGTLMTPQVPLDGRPREARRGGGWRRGRFA